MHPVLFLHSKAKHCSCWPVFWAYLILEEHLGKCAVYNLGTDSMKQKPDVSYYCQVFTVKTGLTFGKPEYDLSSFFEIFLFLPLFFLPILSHFPLATGETDINLYFYICI